MDRLLKIKVCGMRDPENVKALAKLKPDFMGLIFYSGSRRFAGGLDPVTVRSLPPGIMKTGVFVNTDTDQILNTVKEYDLNFIQLHGDETAETCALLNKTGIRLIKAVRIGIDFDFRILENYTNHCEYFLFDTKGEDFGGTGEKFNWNILDKYPGEKPFFLSGGIGLEDAHILSGISHPAFFGVDINSRFETAAGMKDIERIRSFIDIISSRRLLQI